jgi:hypothetical protein
MLSIKRQEISLNGQKNVIDVCLLSQFFDTNLARKNKEKETLFVQRG